MNDQNQKFRIGLFVLGGVVVLLAMLFSLAACGKEETQLEKTARYLQAQVPEPACTAVGGDWLVFALARSGVKVPQKYFDTYYKNTEEYVASVNGVLSRKKNTEYSRVVLALTAIGKDPQNVAGFDLLLPLGDFDETVSQGVKYIPDETQKLLFKAYELSRSVGSASPKTVKSMAYGKTSTGQYVGSGFYAPDMIDGVEKFTAIFVHKTRFGPPSKTLQTMGEQINFQTPTTSGEALVDDAGHLMEWDSFDTEAEAIAWLDACFTTEPTVVTEGG